MLLYRIYRDGYKASAIVKLLNVAYLHHNVPSKKMVWVGVKALLSWTRLTCQICDGLSTTNQDVAYYAMNLNLCNPWVNPQLSQHCCSVEIHYLLWFTNSSRVVKEGVAWHSWLSRWNCVWPKPIRDQSEKCVFLYGEPSWTVNFFF